MLWNGTLVTGVPQATIARVPPSWAMTRLSRLITFVQVRPRRMPLCTRRPRKRMLGTITATSPMAAAAPTQRSTAGRGLEARIHPTPAPISVTSTAAASNM